MKPKKSAVPKKAKRQIKPPVKTKNPLKGKLQKRSASRKKAKTVAVPIVKNKDSLSLQQEQFCKLYATDVEFFGNGVKSYVEAYDVNTKNENWYNVASAAASRLLRNVKISNRITQLLDMNGFNELHADKQLFFLMTQYDDFRSKLGAIKEFNSLKNRIMKKVKVEHDISKLSEEQLDAILQGKVKDIQDAKGLGPYGDFFPITDLDDNIE